MKRTVPDLDAQDGIGKSPPLYASAWAGGAVLHLTYPCPMRPENLTPAEVADQLGRIYAGNQGDSDDLPSPEEHTALAD